MMPRRYGIPQPQEPIRDERGVAMPAVGTLIAITILVCAVVYVLSIAGVRL